ncbi:MAG: transglutaminase family protein [Bythopirellula sp.]|nr:transglutaminase family protein [Bythopirellula sp.]
MSIRVALHHRTEYRYDDPSEFGPHMVRLRPAPHTRTPVLSYSLRVEPAEHYVNWQQDPYGNYVGRFVFPERSKHLVFEVDLTAEMTVINPFNFFLEPDAEEYPFAYHPTLLHDLMPFLHVSPALDNSLLATYVRSIDRTRRRTIDFLVELNQKLSEHISYLIRMEPGVQTCDETLTKRSGSCRDTSWLLVNLLRHMGLAARFTSGYLIQLKPDEKPLEGPAGTSVDFTDLHAWAEVFLPGAGWVGLDPTSGLFTGEGHIPLACTPEPISAAAITGTTSEPPADFKFDMTLTRIHEDPRVTKPYTDDQWQAINSLGQQIDEHLQAGDVRLTMGGEPTFVSVDDMEAAEWKTEALGETKRKLAGDLLWRLKHRFSSGALVHFGQGKWYPGEPLPRWALRCYWRKDFEPIWQDDTLIADPVKPGTHTAEDAQRFAQLLAEKLRVNPAHVINGYEDALYYTWKERRLPVNVNIRDSKLEDEVERARLARVFEQGITSPVGCVLPLRRVWWAQEPYWESGEWVVRSEEMFLIPGDSAMGYRLPIMSLAWYKRSELEKIGYAADPIAPRGPLPQYRSLRDPQHASFAKMKLAYAGGGGGSFGGEWGGGEGDGFGEHSFRERGDAGNTNGHGHEGNGFSSGLPFQFSSGQNDPSQVVRTAICIEPRGGVLHLFMPPIDHLVDYLDLVAKIEATAAELQLPIAIEGYEPPHDHRLDHLKVTPDPGVIEVNVHPAANWRELVDTTTGVYEDARNSRLGTEKFDLDGTHTGTGGGNHVVLGGPTPSDSPFLRRPDLLKSLVGYWHNHPSLSYLFSGSFIGPTSQAPRVDEGRRDARYELQIAFEQVAGKSNVPPWIVDRVFRHLLVDVTGNTHRAEFCIDKMYSPDTATGRLGLIEFRGFEMPPHARMSLAQQVLLRALVAHFWESPYETPLVDWDTSLHDRFMLPHFAQTDFADVVEEIRLSGYAIDAAWFGPHFEFRYPVIGTFSQANVRVELRKAVEPWYVLGEEAAGGAMARYVDSSVERLQVKVQGMTNPRHMVTCNGRKLPLHPTGVEGEYVAGVRYRAWQPPSCLHPTIPVDTPLVFDVLDTWMRRSMGGSTYYVSHPGGLNPSAFPVNAFEAESRRGARFVAMGHHGGEIAIPRDEVNPDYPMTLDLRRGRQNGLLA